MNMTKRNQLGSVLVLLVFAIFTASVLLVLLTGADAVQKLNERDQGSYDRRTVVQYITTRIRQGDQRDMVEVREMEGRSVLTLKEQIEGVDYETFVYCYDGYLCELFVEAGLDMALEFGEWILPLQALNFEDEGTAIRANIVMEDGTERNVILMLRGERGNMQ